MLHFEVFSGDLTGPLTVENVSFAVCLVRRAGFELQEAKGLKDRYIIRGRLFYRTTHPNGQRSKSTFRPFAPLNPGAKTGRRSCEIMVHRSGLAISFRPTIFGFVLSLHS